MKTFLTICKSNSIPRDGYYYPRGYTVINIWLTHKLNLN